MSFAAGKNGDAFIRYFGTEPSANSIVAGGNY
jgi:hypothetical protein